MRIDSCEQRLPSRQGNPIEGRVERAAEEVIVKTRGALDSVTLASRVAPLGLAVVRQFEMSDARRARLGGDLYLLRGAEAASEQQQRALEAVPDIVYAAPNDRITCASPAEAAKCSSVTAGGAGRSPNDLDPRLWGLRNTARPGADIGAVEAWGLTTGRRQDGPIVAVLDSGIDYRHPDLAANMWNNPDPRAADRHGYSFVDNTPDPMDRNQHGTHVAGTIAAVGDNGQGVVGVSWEGRLMAVKFLDANGSGTVAGAISGMLYADDHGARIVNASWGGPGFNQAVYDVIRSSSALYVVAAGNSGSDNDRAPIYPASYDLPNIISVAASTPTDERHRTSNHGRLSVDLAAPGRDILSTVPDGGLAVLSGTSMAAPHVAGAAALVWSRFPNLTPEQVKARLLYGSDRVPAWAGLTVTGGRLDAFRALESDATPPKRVGDLRALATGLSSAVVAWTATGDDGSAGTAAACEMRVSSRPIVEGVPRPGEVGFDEAEPVDTAVPGPSGTSERNVIRYEPAPSPRTLHVALRAVDNVGNASPLATVAIQVPGAEAVFDDRGAPAPGWACDAPWSSQSDPVRGRVWGALPTDRLPNDLDAALTSPVIDLRGRTTATLSFAVSRDLDPRRDFLLVETRSEGEATWRERARFSGRGEWERQLLDVADLAGRGAQMRFRLVTDSVVRSRGAAVDDVVLWSDVRRVGAEGSGLQERTIP